MFFICDYCLLIVHGSAGGMYIFEYTSFNIDALFQNVTFAVCQAPMYAASRVILRGCRIMVEKSVGKRRDNIEKNQKGQNFQIHQQAPIASLVRHRYLNEPSEQMSIPDETFKKDKSNGFIKFNISKNRFEFDDRAYIPRSCHSSAPQCKTNLSLSMHSKTKTQLARGLLLFPA